MPAVCVQLFEPTCAWGQMTDSNKGREKRREVENEVKGRKEERRLREKDKGRNLRGCIS